MPLDPDPDPQTQMNPDPTGSGSGSGSTSLVERNPNRPFSSDDKCRLLSTAFTDLGSADHTDGAEVPVGEGEQGHEEDVGGVRLKHHRGQAPVLRGRVADHEQRDEAQPTGVD